MIDLQMGYSPQNLRNIRQQYNLTQKEVAKIADGRGGGKPEMAQAGIKLIEKSDEIFTAVSNML